MHACHKIPNLIYYIHYKLNGDNDLISKWDVEIDYVLVMMYF